ncbi:MAG: EmrB/QacA family drug resistance transporter, partial [Actinomycetes bacterium]
LLLMPRGVGVLICMALAGQLMQRGLDPRVLVASGLLITCYSLYDMTGWALVISTERLIWSGMIQGLGLGLVFVPLNVIAFATLLPRHRTEAASLMNLLRNLGASIGISIVTLLAARNAQTSHADLAGHVTQYSIEGVDPALATLYPDAAQAAAMALDAEINRQAAMIAYLDDFWLMMIVTAASIPLVLLLRNAPQPPFKPRRAR